MGLLVGILVVLFLGAVDYYAWCSTVDDPFWGTVTGLTDWVLVLALLVLVALLIRKLSGLLRSRASR